MFSMELRGRKEFEIFETMKTKSIIIVLITQIFCLMANAEKVESNGLWYELVSQTKEAEVSFGYSKYSGNIDIPATVVYKGEVYSVTGIGYGAFRGCTGLSSVTIPNSVTGIGEFTFSGCSLTSVKIPSSVTNIGIGAFEGCSSLISVTMSNGLTTIGDCVFQECSSLTSVTIPNSVTSIGNDAFNNCHSLTSVTIGNSVMSIGVSVFSFCPNLTSISVAEDNPIYDSRNTCNAIIETMTNTLIGGCKNTIIPNSVTGIGYGAFEGCTSLTSVTIPNSVTRIGERA